MNFASRKSKLYENLFYNVPLGKSEPKAGLNASHDT